jgi:hypothetical protein
VVTLLIEKYKSIFDDDPGWAKFDDDELKKVRKKLAERFSRKLPRKIFYWDWGSFGPKLSSGPGASRFEISLISIGTTQNLVPVSLIKLNFGENLRKL